MINAPVKTLTRLHDEIRSGDLLLCSGNSALSRMIQHTTKSLWSHVAILVRVEGLNRVMVLESVEDVGVRCVPLSYYVTNYDDRGCAYNGALLIARHDALTEAHVPALFDTAAGYLGYRYDTEEIARIACRIMSRGVVKPVDTDVSIGKSFICSEYAYVCFKAAGLDIAHSGGDFVTPNDFFTDPAVKSLAFLSGL